MNSIATHIKLLVVTFALHVPLATSGFAQEAPAVPEAAGATQQDSIRFNTVAIGLEQNLNTFNWIGRARIDTTAWGTIVQLTEQYLSNTILLDGGASRSRNLQSDQQNLSLLLGRSLTHNLTSEIQWKSLVYSDNKSVGLGQAMFHSVLGGMNYAPFDFLFLNPLIGYRWDNQAGVQDKGISYTMAVHSRDVDLDGYQLYGSGQFHEDRLDPRLLQRHFVRAGALKHFSSNTRDSLEVGYGRNRNEFYAIADSNIESRIENIFSFANLLDYEFDTHFLTTLFISMSNRSLDKDIRHIGATLDPTPPINTAIEESRLETFVQGTYRSLDGGIQLGVRLGHSERNEQHSAKPTPNAGAKEVEDRDKEERSKDNFARRTSLTGMLRLPLSLSDTVFFSGATSILRYDTPDDLNPDIRVDRDELLVALSLSTRHRLSQYLDIGVSLDGNLSHVVYLFSKWSGNNNYNRVLRLSPTTTYRPVREISTTNSFEVLANYTVYDYEQQVSGVRSFSYRQFGWVDSSIVEFSRRIGLDFFSYLKLYERGQLNWSDFSERTENSFVDKTISSQIRFSPQEGLLFAVGIRYFSQTRYSFTEGVKALDSFVRSIGPTCLVFWEASRFSSLMVRGWYEQRTFSGSQTQQAETTESFPNVSMNITINL
jgi:hypothetical protein